jgi:hypothetical protein
MIEIVPSHSGAEIIDSRWRRPVFRHPVLLVRIPRRRAGAIDIGKAVDLRQSAARKRLTIPSRTVRICRKRYHGAPRLISEFRRSQSAVSSPSHRASFPPSRQTPQASFQNTAIPASDRPRWRPRGASAFIAAISSPTIRSGHAERCTNQSGEDDCNVGKHVTIVSKGTCFQRLPRTNGTFVPNLFQDVF